MTRNILYRKGKFLSTLSLRRATKPPSTAAIRYVNFYPRSPCGERLSQSLAPSSRFVFLSTLSLRRATGRNDTSRSAGRCISIHALLAESDILWGCLMIHLLISIHALLAESDQYRRDHIPADDNFYPRSPCGERLFCPVNVTQIFNDFYPRSPCGERRRPNSQSRRLRKFLSTLSLRRATLRPVNVTQIFNNFYPRSPCGERQHITDLMCLCLNFYPRSPCGERHCNRSPATCHPNNFYPRSPYGERPVFALGIPTSVSFLSTLSLRRATRQPCKYTGCCRYFYPRSPCGERQDVVPL